MAYGLNEAGLVDDLRKALGMQVGITDEPPIHHLWLKDRLDARRAAAKAQADAAETNRVAAQQAHDDAEAAAAAQAAHDAHEATVDPLTRGRARSNALRTSILNAIDANATPKDNA